MYPYEWDQEVMRRLNVIAGAPDYYGGSGLLGGRYYLDDSLTDYFDISYGTVRFINVEPEQEISEQTLIADKNGRTQLHDAPEDYKSRYDITEEEAIQIAVEGLKSESHYPITDIEVLNADWDVTCRELGGRRSWVVDLSYTNTRGTKEEALVMLSATNRIWEIWYR